VRRLRLRVGAGAFALAALLLFGNAVAEHSTAGLGRNLSDAVVASIAALAFGRLARRERSTGA